MSGASAADVRSILSLPPSGGASTSSQQLPKKSGSNRKPEGISRELYALIGPSVPSLLPSSKPRLKQKPNLGGSRKVKWERRSFHNSARKDSMELRHWVKATDDPDEEYPFAKYDVQPNIYTYSQDEYTRLLEDPEWTKEETDYLFDVVREYDLRWFIIYDRYEYPGGLERSVEDLKDRYYSVCRKLVRSRPWPGDETSKSQLLSSFQFDKEREMTRKKYLASLASRTPAQLAEEEALFIEIKRLEQTERRFKKDRDELLRTLAGIESGLEGLPVDDDGPMGAGDSKKRKRHGGEWESASVGPSNVISLGTPVPKKGQQSTKSTVPSPEEDVLHCIHRSSAPAPSNLPVTKNAHTPVYLRSFKIPVPKPATLAPKITAALAELGINHTRLVMPTKENCERLENLLDAAAALVDLKRTVDRVEQEIRTMRMRVESKSNSGSLAGDTAETPMDVDQDETGTERDADGEKEDDSVRGQSVVSIRSARGRKSSRRSMSISSVDTAAHVSTRATKRMKK